MRDNVILLLVLTYHISPIKSVWVCFTFYRIISVGQVIVWTIFGHNNLKDELTIHNHPNQQGTSIKSERAFNRKVLVLDAYKYCMPS